MNQPLAMSPHVMAALAFIYRGQAFHRAEQMQHNAANERSAADQTKNDETMTLNLALLMHFRELR